MKTNLIHSVMGTMCLCLFLAGGMRAQEFIELKPDHFGRYVYAAAFSHDSKRIVMRDLRTIRICDTETGHEIKSWEMPFLGGGLHSAPIAFSPDGKTLAVGIRKIVQIIEIETGKTLHELQGHEGPIVSAAFSPDGKKLVTSSYDKTARIWEVDSGKELQKLEGHTGFVLSAVFLPDGKEILTTGSGSSTVTIRINDETETYQANDDRTARIWDAESGKELNIVEVCKDNRHAALSSDGKKYARFILQRDENSRGINNYLVVYDTDTGAELCKIEIIADDIGGEVAIVLPPPMLFTGFPNLAFSPDGKRVIATSTNGLIRLFDIELGRELRQWKNVRGSSAFFSPDGKKIALISADRIVQIWDVEALLKSAPPAMGEF